MSERIVITDMSKKIKDNLVLNDINIEFNGGTIYGLCGANGSGKTMLIRSIAGLMKPSAGEIIYNKKKIYKDIDFIPELGLLIENIGLYQEFSGLENLMLLAKIKGKCKYDTIADLMREFSLDPHDKRRIKKYSLGMKQKLSIIQAFMEEPRVILLDEPTNALDTQSIGVLLTMCKRAKDSGAIIVIASHDKEVLNDFCEVKYNIRQGKIV